MALGLAPPDAAFTQHRLKRTLLGVAAGVVAAGLGFAALVWVLSGVSLASDTSALARVDTKPLAGTVRLVEAWTSGGRRIPLALKQGRLTPLVKLRPGEAVSVEVRVRRPGWLSWALGAERVEHLSVHAPVSNVAQQWITTARRGEVRVGFQTPVSAVAYGVAGHTHHLSLSTPARTVSIGQQPPTGTLEVAAAARPWETLGTRTQVSWFPPSREPVLATLPAAGAQTTPAGSLYLTFSQPVAAVLGGARPRLSPAIAGVWREANSHTLVFTPAGYGAPMGSEVRLQLPRAVAIASGAGANLHTTSEIGWPVPAGSMLRAQQLLAEQGYLPVEWRPSGAAVEHTASAEVKAAVDPPAGSFAWRYPNTPHQLQGLWSAGQENDITRGAVMKFESLHNLTADAVVGAAVWRALLHDAIAGKRLGEPYSYVYVHREIPELLTLWSAGRTVLTSAANTGIAGAETALGTYPVFEHIPEGTMSGTNPDGSHYSDPGIKWISYFNGGDALHNFDRASFGTPQSLGCVELPLAASAAVWKYTPIGTLVTIET
jgi:hypothetical protein